MRARTPPFVKSALYNKAIRRESIVWGSSIEFKRLDWHVPHIRCRVCCCFYIYIKSLLLVVKLTPWPISFISRCCARTCRKSSAFEKSHFSLSRERLAYIYILTLAGDAKRKSFTTFYISFIELSCDYMHVYKHLKGRLVKTPN